MPHADRFLTEHSEEHSLLPIGAQRALKAAAAFDPDVMVGDSPLRKHAIEQATEAARRLYPHLFRNDRKEAKAA